MTAASQKAFRDAWYERSRSVFVMATIAIGLAALLSLLGAYAVLTRELNHKYLATHPASAILHVDSVDSRMLAAVRADSEIGKADARRILFGRVKTGPMQWHNLALFVIPDYGSMDVSRFVPDGGAWPPTIGDVLIERDAFQIAHAKIGDDITLRIGDGQPHALHVSGRVHDVGQAQARMENSVYGYITPDTATDIGETSSLNLVLIEVASDKYDPAHIRQVVQRLQKTLQDQGFRVNSVEFPTPGKHPHADLMGGLLLTISSFGFFLLAMSGILTVNFIAALMSKQTRQIGVMKALGATRWQLFRIYALHSLLLGAVATIVAMPIGILGCRQIALFMAALLNFDVTSFSIPAWVYAATLGAGIAVPLIASVVPVWRSIAIPVRRALTSTGATSETFGRDWLDRLLAGVGTGMRPVLLSIRNGFRRRARFALTCAALACGVMFFMAAVSLRTSMRYSYDRLFAAERYDLTLYLDKMYPASDLDQALHGVQNVSSSENWIADDGWTAPEDSGGVASTPNSPSSLTEGEKAVPLRVIAIPANSHLFVPVMAKGRRLQEGDTNSVVLNPSMAAQSPHVSVGDNIRLRIGSLIHIWRVVGISRELASPPIAYVPISSLNVIHRRMANVVQISLQNPNAMSLDQARAQIDPNLDREGIRVNGSRSTAEYHAAVDQHILMIYVFLVVASFIVAIVGGIGLMTTMVINVLERRRELGILRTIGATPRILAALVIGEALTVAVIAWGLGILLATPLTEALAAMISRLLHVEFELKLASLGAAEALGASVAAGILASLLAAVSAVRLSVREALMYE